MAFLLLAFIGAVFGYWIAARRAQASRLDLLLGAAIGGGLAGAVFAGMAAAAGAKIAVALPWALYGLGAGALLGALGLAARALGAWLSRKP